MIKKFFNKKTVFIPLIFIQLIIVILVIFPPDIAFFQKFSEFALPVIFVYTALGLFFLVTDNARLVMVSLCCAAAISLFIKNFSNKEMILPVKKGNIEISVANINLINFDGKPEALFRVVDEVNADILCFHKVNPLWAEILINKLSIKYPHKAPLVRMDAFGKMIFLKSGYARLDTVYYNQIPDLVVTIPKGNNDILLISSQIVPPFNDSYEGSTSSEHLLSLSNYISLRGKPLLLTGQFNQVYWSQEMRIFTNVTRLENSRKSLSMLLNGVPYEHIFYSAEFECTRLDELYDDTDNHIGIFGEYQLGSKTGRFTKANAL